MTTRLARMMAVKHFQRGPSFVMVNSTKRTPQSTKLHGCSLAIKLVQNMRGYYFQQ